MLYLTGLGFSNLRKNAFMTVAGIGVLGICLMITGVAMLFTLNVDSLVEYLGTKNETVVYIDSTVSDTRTGEIYDEILAISGVDSAQFTSKEDVLSDYSGYLGEYSDLLSAFEDDNPFKAHYSVVLNDLERMEEIKTSLESIDGVLYVSAPVEMTNVFVEVQSVVSVVGYVLVSVLMLVSLVVISNTIRLSVYARKTELNIMKFVGATNRFIRWPFFVEGIMVGFIAAVLALGAVFGGYYLLLEQTQYLSGFWMPLLGSSVVPMEEVYPWMVPSFLLAGVLIGSTGTVFSIYKHLDV